jgi:type IV pilus assembly protein PilY1
MTLANRTSCTSRLVATVMFAGMASWAGAAAAKTTDLITTPPDLTTSVPPNIAVTFDDSGSMGNAYMGDTRPFDGGGWNTGQPWMCAGVIDPRVTDTKDRRSAAMNGVYYNPNITYAPPVYADGTSFPNADATLRYVWLDGVDVNRPASAGPTTPEPNAEYLGNRSGESDKDDKRVTDMTGTWSQTTTGSGKSQVTDIRWACAGTSRGPYTGTTADPNGLKRNGGPFYYRLKSGVSITNSDGSVNTSTLYTSSNWEAVQVPTAQFQNFANWFAYYRTRNLMTRTTLSQAFAKIGNSIRVVWQSMNRSTAPGVTITSSSFMQDLGNLDSQVRRDMYDWIFQTAGSYTTPARAATIRASNIFRRSLTKDKYDPYWNGNTAAADSADLVCRKNFHMLVTDGYWNEGDPSPPAATNGVPAMTSANTSDTAQTLPDTVAYDPAAAVSTIYGNVNGGAYLTSMANISWYFWANDMQPTLKDGVKPYWADLSAPTGVKVDPANPGATPVVYWNPANDPATWQHVSQFFVTLGVAGTLDFPGDLTALRAGTKQWPYPQNNSASAVDDTWHGAVNSRGGFFNASDPQSLVNGLVNIINSVVTASSSSVSAALSTGVLNDGSVTYIPSFTSSDWTGKLDAYLITTTGANGAVQWAAEDLLDKRAFTDRLIATTSGAGQSTGIVFSPATLKASAPASWAIMHSSDGSGTTSTQESDDTNATARINWVAGKRTDEGALLRTRSSTLGAIINSQPVYVSYPSSGYRDFFPKSDDGTAAPETAAYVANSTASYSQYVANNKARKPTVYVGANDGMLHAFDATTATSGTDVPGRERWSFVPSAVMSNLYQMTKKDNFQYAPTVDATPIYRDVYFSQGAAGVQGWHTILIGGLRLGGRGVYALDITDPTATTAAAAASKVLWEFTSDSKDSKGTAVGANLGFTYGTPNVARLSSGRWVVLVPGGYFPSSNTNPPAAASNTYSSLFVLDAQTGVLLKEFKTPTTYGGATITSYGLSSPVLGDYNNDQIDDVAFAGDLVGNMWRFDLKNLAAGKVDLLFKPDTNEAQPITTMPRLMPDPTSQYFMVVFGTGKFLGLEDRTTTGAVTQSVYGIRDPGPSATGLPVVRSSLLTQNLAEDATGARSLTSATITTSQKGWYFDLNISGVKGERVVATPTALFDTNRVIVSTLIPTTADPCDPGRDGAIMVVDAATGGAGAGVNVGFGTFGTGYTAVGARVKNPPASGGLPAATVIGGGSVIIPGTTLTKTGTPFTVGAPIWRRRSWRILNDQ